MNRGINSSRSWDDHFPLNLPTTQSNHSFFTYFSRNVYFVISFRFNMHTFTEGQWPLNESFNTEKKKKPLLKEVGTENRNPDWDSNYTLAWWEVWKEAAKRHTQRQNSQQKNVQIKREKDETQMFRELAEIGCEIECEQKKGPKWSETLRNSCLQNCN